MRDAVFKRPVRLGDTIRVEGRCGEVAPTGIMPVTLRVLCEDRLAAKIVLDVVVREVPAALEEPELVCVPL